VAFDPLTAGTTTIAAAIPGFVALPAATVVMTVSAPAITLNAITVGGGLQESVSGSLGAAAPAGGVTVRITSLDPSVALVSGNDSTPGTAFIDVAVNQGVTFFTYYVQGVEAVTGTASITATIPAYTDDTMTVTVRQAALDVIFLGATTTTLSPHTAFAVRIGVVNAAGTAFTAEQGVRAGGTAVTATLTSTAPAVGQLVTTAQTGGVVTVDVGVRQSRSAGTVATGGVAFDPLTAGTTTIAATIPGFVALPGATVVVTVSAPAINLNALAVGAGLQESASGSLGAAVPVGGLTIRITSSNPDVVLISPNATTPGTAFIDVTVNQGASFFTYYVQGVEDTSGTVTVTAKAPGYTDGTETVTVRQPALDIIFLPSTTRVGAANILFEVRIGVPNAGFTAYTAEQAIRAGGLVATATVTTSAPGVAQLVTTALTGGTVTVVIAAGQSRSPGTVALGGVAFHPLALGTTNVGATIPGFFALPGALIPVTVNP
jgi:hypothetical protein